MTREEAGAKLADEYASKHWSGDDYTAAFDSFIAGYQAALTPQPSAEDAAVLDALECAIHDWYQHKTPHPPAMMEAVHAKRQAVLARMAGKEPEGWRLVPETPTQEMLRDGGEVLRSINMFGDGWAMKTYAAMLAAAPKVPT